MLDFLGIGAQKCATSWMYENLAGHPEIRFPAGKEVHFWDRPDGRTIADWRALFEKNVELRWDRVRRAIDPRFIPIKQGEITPAYAFLAPKQIASIFAIYPGLRLLFNIRNPIERVWSHARMRLARQDIAGDAATDEWLFTFFASEDCVKRTDYLATLRNWTGICGEEPLLVTLFDDISAHPAAVLARMAAHIGCRRPYLAGQCAAGGVPRNVGRAAQMPPHVRAWLTERYRDDIGNLSERLKRNLDHWTMPGAA